MSKTRKLIFKALSYIFALLAGGSLASCNFTNVTPLIF